MTRPTRVPLTTLVLFLAAIAAGRTARGDECTSPPPGSPPASQTRDDFYAAMWCNNQIGADMWSGLHLDHWDWDDGYGLAYLGNNAYTPTCQPNDFLTRLFNAAWIVNAVQDHAVNFGLHRQVCGLDDPAYGLGWWWFFASTVEPDEWEPLCETGGNAVNHTGVDDYIGLKIPGAYNQTAMYRSAIVVHEPTHEDVGHIDDEACSAQGSCDDAYGNYNANTMHINYLYDAAGAYVTQLYNGQPVRPVSVNNGQCAYIPRFTFNERQEALTKSENDLVTRFESAPPPGIAHYYVPADIDAANGIPFDCQLCDDDKYTFHPNQCAQTACNEVLNPSDFLINLSNRYACNLYNSEVGDPLVTPEIVASAKADMQAALQACAGPSDQAARDYCDAEKASANFASQVDQCAWLDTYSSPQLNGQLGCVQEFCQEKWNQGGGWTVNQDPYGCGAYLCGGSACGSAADEAACKEQVVVMHADPDFYVPQCEFDSCKGGLATCLVDLHHQNQWSYGDPIIPTSCHASYAICMLGQKLHSMVWTEYRPWYDPGPLREMQPEVMSTQPAKHWNTYVKTFRDAVARGAGSEELSRLAVRLTANPEMVVALYNAAPGEFVGLFGKDGFAELLGPGLARVVPKALDAKKLTPQGQAALAELQDFLARLPRGQAKAAIGSIGTSTK